MSLCCSKRSCTDGKGIDPWLVKSPSDPYCNYLESGELDRLLGALLCIIAVGLNKQYFRRGERQFVSIADHGGQRYGQQHYS
jgi:hypothetical protein